MYSNITKSVATNDDMAKIQEFARKELTTEEIYTFNVSLCNNDVDRDFEKFSLKALEELAPMFVGKTGIFDHSMKARDQKARIFDTYVERVNGKITADGEDMYALKAKVYMLNNEENKGLIDEIDAGIKKEVSVSCSMDSATCSICGADKRKAPCQHRNGREYDNKLCFSILDGATDAYEFSFVAVPAQREAGVTKAYGDRKECNMTEVIEKMGACDGEVVLTKSQARQISSYIDDLKEGANLGNEYKKQLSKEVVGMLKKAFPNTEEQIFASITSVMTTKELLGFIEGEKKEAQKKSAKPQLSTIQKGNKHNYSQFKI